jgi:hypothetical protein
MFRTMSTCIGIIVVIGIIFPVFLFVVPPLAWFYIRVMTYVWQISGYECQLTLGLQALSRHLP